MGLQPERQAELPVHDQEYVPHDQECDRVRHHHRGQGADAGLGGIIASNLPVQAGTTPLPGDMGSEIRKILAGTGTVTGSGNRYLSITCPGP